MIEQSFDLTGVRIRRQQQTSASDQSPPLDVCPFTILIDSREQLPYDFAGMVGQGGAKLIVPKLVVGLRSGDYSISGLDDQVAVERKSLEDLYGSVTFGRDRFEREISRLDDLPGFAAVVIEATWEEIADPAGHRPGWTNQTNPRSVEGTIAAWSIRYRHVVWWAAGSRRSAELRTFGILKAFWNKQQK